MNTNTIDSNLRNAGARIPAREALVMKHFLTSLMPYEHEEHGGHDVMEGDMQAGDDMLQR